MFLQNTSPHCIPSTMKITMKWVLISENKMAAKVLLNYMSMKENANNYSSPKLMMILLLFILMSKIPQLSVYIYDSYQVSVKRKDSVKIVLGNTLFHPPLSNKDTQKFIISSSKVWVIPNSSR